MSKTRHIDTITDYLIVAFSPALVMFMVGSLVFFAINCFYVGNFDGRLYFATGLFVFAAVLISRISIDEGREYASMFAVPLSITTILSIMRYTDVNLLFILPLVGFIWWSTDKLTWDCTVIDTKKDASGEGLLQTIGLDDDGEISDDASGSSSVEGEAEHVQEHLDAEATTNREEADSKSIWQWWIERRQRNHTPGVWVIYFGLAAIPIFGLGQLLLSKQQYGPSFFLLCIYVASALSLLMATSFLQMRRYLNQRRLPFTDAMAGVWLSNGGVLIVALMFLCLLLPRPNTGYSLVDQIGKIGSKDQKASRMSPYKKNAINDEDQEGDGESDEDAESDSDGTQTSEDAEKGSKSGDDAKTKGNKQSESGKRDSGDSDESNDNSDESDDSNQPDETSEPESEDGGESEKSQAEERDTRVNANDEQEGSKKSGEQESENEDGKSSSASPSSKVKPPQLPDFIPKISMPSIPKLVYFVLIGALILFVFLRYGRQIGAAINAFLRDLADFLRRLFGGKPRSREAVEEEVEAEVLTPPRPFSSFPDPFAMGTADRYTPQQLVSYTFEALQAWAYERDCSRTDEQTPLEFATQIAGTHKQVGPAARNLAMLYNQAAYAPGTIGSDSLEHVQTLWKALRTRS